MRSAWSPHCIYLCCVVWRCAWHIVGVRPPCPAVLAARHAPIVRNLSCSSRSCAPYGDSPDLGYARLVTQLACLGSGLRTPTCEERSASCSQSLSSLGNGDKPLGLL